MHSGRLSVSGLLLGLLLTAPASALPQSQGDRAYPLERYLASDYQRYNPQTLFDLLTRLPGITLGQQPDGREEVQLHGLDSRYLTLLINGQPLTGTAINSSLTTRQIPASLVARIEIDRNARADLYTGGGGAGTINVILHDSDSAPTLQLSAGGPLLSNREALSLRWESGPHALRLAAGHALERQQQNGDSEEDTRSGAFQLNSRERSHHLLLNYSGLLNQRHPLRLYALQLDADEDLSLQGLHPLNTLSSTSSGSGVQSLQQRLQRTSRRVGGDLRMSWRTLSLTAFAMAEDFRQQHHTGLQQLPLSAPLLTATQQQDLHDRRLHAGWQLQQSAYEHRWRTGLSLQYLQRQTSSRYTHLLSTNNERNALPYDFTYDEYRLSFFLLDRWQLTPRTRFEAGFHVDTYDLYYRDTSALIRQDRLNDTHWLPSFHLQHQLSGSSRLRLSLSQSTRQPEIADRVPYEFRQDSRIWRGNPDLDAELVSSLDIGYEHNLRLRGSSRSDEASGVYVRLFQRIIRNAIVLQPGEELSNGQTFTVLQPQNTRDMARLYGAEADLELNVWGGSKLEAGVAAYLSSVHTRTPLPGSQRLPGQPDYLLRLGLRQQRGHWHYGLLWRWQGDTDQYLPQSREYSLQRRSALQQLDLYSGYQWRRWQTRLSASLSPEPAVSWQQNSSRQHLDRLWSLRVSLEGQF